ncbi:glycosyltransferase [Salinisphaera orenii]|nr:glycosyltransferase [Salinisphaera orenii]
MSIPPAMRDTGQPMPAAGLAHAAPDHASPTRDIRAPAWTLAVCVPVRDERDHLPALLDALARQTVADDTFVLCLLFDGCSDGGARYVQQRAAALPYAVVTQRIPRQQPASAGRARRAAMALGAATLARGGPADAAPDDAFLLSTDADSVPADDWLAANRHALAAVDVVAGYIERPDAAPSEAHRRVERYWERLRCLQRTVDPLPHDPAPSHPSQGGASLAFRAAVYAALGGFEDIAAHEDLRLVTAARRAGYRVRHDRAVRVATSSRLIGRADAGLAETLRTRAADRNPPRVEAPDAALARFRRAAAARRAFAALHETAIRDELATLLAIDADELRRLAAPCDNAEAFVMAVVPDPCAADEIALDQAETRLHALETEHACPSP